MVSSVARPGSLVVNVSDLLPRLTGRKETQSNSASGPGYWQRQYRFSLSHVFTANLSFLLKTRLSHYGLWMLNQVLRFEYQYGE